MWRCFANQTAYERKPIWQKGGKDPHRGGENSWSKDGAKERVKRKEERKGQEKGGNNDSIKCRSCGANGHTAAVCPKKLEKGSERCG